MFKLVEWVNQNPIATAITLMILLNLVILVFREGSQRFKTSGWIPLVSFLFVIIVVLVSISLAPALELSPSGAIAYDLGLCGWYVGTRIITKKMRKIELQTDRNEFV